MSDTGSRERTPAVAMERVSFYPQGRALQEGIARRKRVGRIVQAVLLAAIVVATMALTALLANIIDQAFGYVAVVNQVDPRALGPEGQPLGELAPDALVSVLAERLSPNLLRRLDGERPLAERGREELEGLVMEYVVRPRIVASWSLSASLFQRDTIADEVQGRYPGARLEFRSWVNAGLLTRPQSGDPEGAGIRPALLGSLWMMAITILFAFPVGVGAAIYLEEYAEDTLLRRVIETNIDNLAGVPSIIYGMLGLAVFVRALQPLSSGAVFGVVDPANASGRTVLAAGVTLGLLVLPLVIISAREAVRAVPLSRRQASYALGATRWQTVWHHVIPGALPGILTGTILAVSRAIGETAPLVVVGASTFVAIDPTGPFAKFTALPVQVYQWTLRPQSQFRNLAAATILVLLVLLLAMNASAVILRNRLRRELS